MALKNIRILHLGFLCVSLKSLFFKATKNKGVLSYGFLCFMLFNLSTAQAQSPENGEAAEGQNEIKPLVIGQLIPEEFWTREHLFFIDGDTIRQDISGHKGKHLIIASWSLDCGSCLTSLPRLQQLQEAFGEHIHILLVNSQTRRNSYERFYNFFNDGHRLLPEPVKSPSVVLDTYFQSLFPIRVLPHYIWIKPGGLVKAILSSEFINERQIREILEREGRI